MAHNDAFSQGPQRFLFDAEGQEALHPLIEPSLFYDPPYERPLEDEFAWHLVKYLNPISGLRYQEKVETPCAHFWVDFVVEHGARRLAFECGDLDDTRDAQQEAFREALILGSGAVDVLYTFRGLDLIYRLHDSLLVASRWDPSLFSERGRINLDTLASDAARAFQPRRSDTVARLRYDEEADDAGLEAAPSLLIRRLSRDNPAAWVRDYDQALAYYGVSPDQLGAQWARSA